MSNVMIVVDFEGAVAAGLSTDEGVRKVVGRTHRIEKGQRTRRLAGYALTWDCYIEMRTVTFEQNAIHKCHTNACTCRCHHKRGLRLREDVRRLGPPAPLLPPTPTRAQTRSLPMPRVLQGKCHSALVTVWRMKVGFVMTSFADHRTISTSTSATWPDPWARGSTA